MTNLNQKFGEAIDKGKKPHPQGGIYWDMGAIQQGCVDITKQIVRDLLTKLRVEHNLNIEIEDYVKENYE